MNKINIAIDGPAGSGKTTTSKNVAKELSYTYIDTGAMYRAAALFWLRSGLQFNEDLICRLIQNLNIDIRQSGEGNRIFLDKQDVSEEIRTPEVTKYASSISAFGCVRERLVRQQKELAKAGGTVLEGRDIGTVVLPDAELKIFLTASIQQRAERRRNDFLEKNIDIPLDELKKQIEERDQNDSTRSNSPLKKAADAIEIDTSNLSIEAQTGLIVRLAKDRIDLKNKK